MLESRRSDLLALAAILVALATGCQETIKDPAADDYEPLPEWTDERPAEQQEKKPQALNDEIFVDAERLEALKEDQQATVVDVRPLSDYQAGHLPGAVHSLHGKDNGEESSYKPFKNPEYQDTLHRDVGHLQEVAREIGIYNDRPVVLYGAPASSKVGRLFWTLEYLGHGSVYIYTPGYQALLDELGVEASTESVDKEGDFIVRRRAPVLATSQEVKQIVEGTKDGVLIDTRRKGEYTGEEPRGNPRAGYIPDAQWYHWEEVFTDTDGKRVLRPKEDLRSELEEAGLFAETKPLIPYCQTGTRSAYTYATLRWLGADKPQNYDGSWARWARITDAPINHDGSEKVGGE